MEYRIPKKGEIYRHFKGNLYEIVIIARDSETLEEKVVYKSVETDSAYVRSLSMFMEPVNRDKYPNVEQTYRFELVETDIVMEYLDLDTVEEKIRYLLRVKEDITGEFLQIVAQSLDFTENEGSIEERYEDILKYLRTLAKFECARLR